MTAWMRFGWGARRLALLTLLLVFGLSTTGCEKIANMIGKKASQQLEKDIEEASKNASKKGKGDKAKGGDDDDKGGDKGGSGGKADYFGADATGLPKLYKTKIGGATRVLEMLIYPNYGYAQIQDPKKLENVDQYDMRDGNVEDGAPVKFIGDQPTAADLKETTFDIDEVDFASIPKIVKDAPVQLKIDGGKVTHIILKRPLPFNKDVRFRVYVDGERKDGSVEYDAKGNMKKVYN